MTNTLKIAAVALALVAANANAQLPVVGGPTNLKAQLEAIGEAVKASEAATAFVALMFDVAPEDVKALTMHTTASIASVTAVTSAKVCELRLSKHVTANEHGWVVQNYSCKAK